MMQSEVLVLRFVHVVGGAFWVGALLFVGFFLLPTLARSGPTAAAQVMQGLQQRKLFTIVPVVALLTILTGFRLMQITSGGVWQDYFATSAGKMYAVSGILAIAGFLLAMTVNRPAALRMAHLAEMMSSAETDRDKLAAEMRVLQQRAAVAMQITAILVALSASGMAVARYL